MTEMLVETVQFSIGTYLDLDENCYIKDWTFDNAFLFVGSLATTIGYGHIVPKSEGYNLSIWHDFQSKRTFRKTTQGRLLCIVFIVFAVPLFAILLQFISLYINENVNALTDVVSFKLSRFRGTWPVRFLEKISGSNELKSTVRKLIKVTQR